MKYNVTVRVRFQTMCMWNLNTRQCNDIGQHFPDTDPEYKGADSRVLLKHVYQLILDRGYQLAHEVQRHRQSALSNHVYVEFEYPPM
jgi:hypothetical protein